MRIALATCAEVPDGDEDAPALTGALAARGVEAVPAIWDDSTVDWGAFELVVVRSTWDYPDRRNEFLAWAESLPRVLNAPEVLRWNTDKRYLTALGDDAVPSRFYEPGTAFEVPDYAFVVKPSVGAGSIGAARYEAGDSRAAAHAAELQAAGKTVLVQPYLEDVDRHGETSLLYAGGVLSHTVRKEAILGHADGPAEGLYVEEKMSPADATREELELGERALQAVPFLREELLYARIDVLPGPLVLEVELTEPSLFLGYADGAVDRFADAIVAAGGATSS